MKRDHYSKQKYAKMGAKAVVGIVDPSGFGISGRVAAGGSLGKTVKKVAAMKAAALEFTCECTDSSCDDVLVYAVWQKEKKAVDKALPAVSIPILTSFAYGIYRTGRNLYKRYQGELGVKREHMAEDLFGGCLDECGLGIRLVQILLGTHYVDNIQDDGIDFGGWKDILMDKLASQ